MILDLVLVFGRVFTRPRPGLRPCAGAFEFLNHCSNTQKHSPKPDGIGDL